MRRSIPLALAVAALGLLPGCGGGDDSTSTQAAKPQGLTSQPGNGDRDVGPTITVAALGDSITAGDPGYDPNPKARAAYGFGKNPQSQYQYWAALDDPRLDFRNCGEFGERTDEIAKRLASCAKGADIVVIQGGINDIAQSLSGADVDRVLAVDEAADNLRDMVEDAKAMGLQVELTDVLPWNNGFPYAAPHIDRLNEKIARIGAEEHVPVLPFHDVLEDPQNPELMAEDWTADGDHPSVEGYRRLGQLAFSLPSTRVTP